MKHNYLKVLFVGNSHTYFNDMPATFKKLVQADGINCDVTMISHGGWFLAQHAAEPDVSFNIRNGNYDYVVLQEHSHPFASEEKYFGAVKTLSRLIAESGAKTVLYETWPMKNQPELNDEFAAFQRRCAEENGALLAPAGEIWWKMLQENPDADLYYVDGGHASPNGSAVAARAIWDTIRADL